MELVSSQVEVEKCEHFTIRGYVAEVRKKDRNLCWPFAIEEQGEQLPPLRVPKFRYWECENAVKNVEMDDVDEKLEMSNSNNNRTQPCVEHSHLDAHLPSHNVSSMSLSGSQPESEERTSEEKKDDTSDMFYLNEVGNSKPFCIDIQEDQDELREDGCPSRNDTVAAVNINCLSESNGDATIQNMNKDTCRLESHSISKDANESSPELMLVKMKRKCMKEGKTERNNKRPGISRKNPTKINQPRKDVANYSVVSGAISMDSHKNETTDSLANHKRKFHSLELDESDDEISAEETTIHRDNLGGPSLKKKPRKSRTLNDILKRAPLSVSTQDYGRKEDDFVGLVESESEESSNGSGTTLGIDLNLSPTHQVDKKRKKKIILVEDEESLQINYQEDVPKRLGEVVARDDRTAFVNDQRVTSNKRKVKNTSGGGPPSEIEPPMAGPSDGGNTVVNNNKSVVTRVLDGKLPLMAPKKSSMTQLKIGDSSFRHQTENPTISRRKPDCLKQQIDLRPHKTSDTSFDDIPMDIVELMAKNQHERLLGASVNDNCLSAEVTNSIPMDNTEAIRNEIPRFLQEKISEKQRTKSSNEAKRVGSSNLMQLPSRVSQFITPNDIHCLPEQSHGSTFYQNQDKELDETQLPIASSFRNSGNQNSSFLKNQGKHSSRAQLLVGSSSREGSRQNSIFLKNWEKPSSEAQFLCGSSNCTRDLGNYNLTSSKSQDPSSEVQFLFGGSARAQSNHNSTFSKNHEKPASRAQFLAGDSNNFCGNQISNWDGKLGNRYVQNCSETPDQYQNSQSLVWQNGYMDDRLSLSSMLPNCLPFQTNKPQKIAFDSNSTNKWNMNAYQSPKPMDHPLTNHLEKKKMNLDTETTKITHPGYPFASRESGGHLNLQPMRPLDLHNNEKIPATHLLRLMDAGMSPSSAINADVNKKFTSQHCLLHNYHGQEMSGFGHSKNNEALMVPPLGMSSGRTQHSRKIGESFLPFPEVQVVGSSAPQLPEVPAVGSFSSRLDDKAVGYRWKKNAIVENNSGSLGSKQLIGKTQAKESQVAKANTVGYTWKKNVTVDNNSGSMHSNQRKGKTQAGEGSSRYKSTKSNKAVSVDGNSVRKHGMSPMCDLGKMVMSTLESMGSLTDPWAMKDSAKQAEFEINKVGTVSTRNGISSTEFCSLNRNPAEFTLPEIGNAFMNGHLDFKPKKNALSPDKAKLSQLLGIKRQKTVKLAAIRDM